MGSIAEGLKNSIFYVFAGGASATLFLAWQWIDFSTSIFWVVVKVLPFIIPLTLWGFLLMVISDLAELPSRTKTAKHDGNAVVQRLKGNKPKNEQPSGFFGRLKKLFRMLRSAGNLAAIVEAVAGVIVIANPIFALLAFISGLALTLLMLISILILIF